MRGRFTDRCIQTPKRGPVSRSLAANLLRSRVAARRLLRTLAADRARPNLTVWNESTPLPPDRAGNYIHYGVREFAMAAIMNGVVLHGGLLPFGAPFGVLGPCAQRLRLAALMRPRVIYALTVRLAGASARPHPVRSHRALKTKSHGARTRGNSRQFRRAPMASLGDYPMAWFRRDGLPPAMSWSKDEPRRSTDSRGAQLPAIGIARCCPRNLAYGASAEGRGSPNIRRSRGDHRASVVPRISRGPAATPWQCRKWGALLPHSIP
jgi:hypothetical protein